MKPNEIILNPEHAGRFAIGKTVVLTPEDAGLTGQLDHKAFPGQPLFAYDSPESLRASLADLALLKRATRKLERLRLKGVFTPTKTGSNRKQRRAGR